MAEDILIRLNDLHRQATEEHSHNYVAKCVREAIDEITRLRHENEILQRMYRNALEENRK